MASGIKIRQYLFFFSILFISGIMTVLLYRSVNVKWVNYRKAENFFSKHEYTEAITFYLKALEAGMENPNAYIHLGEAGLKTGRLDDIFKRQKKYFNLASNKSLLIKELAILYLKNNLFDRAIELYLDNRQIWTEDYSSMVELADLYKYTKNYLEAENLYKKSLIKDPESLPVRLKLAELLSWIGRYDESIVLYRETLKVNPENHQARVHFARVLSWNGLTEEAIIEYKKALGDQNE